MIRVYALITVNVFLMAYGFMVLVKPGNLRWALWFSNLLWVYTLYLTLSPFCILVMVFNGAMSLRSIKGRAHNE